MPCEWRDGAHTILILNRGHCGARDLRDLPGPITVFDASSQIWIGRGGPLSIGDDTARVGRHTIEGVCLPDQKARGIKLLLPCHTRWQRPSYPGLNQSPPQGVQPKVPGHPQTRHTCQPLQNIITVTCLHPIKVGE